MTRAVSEVELSVVIPCRNCADVLGDQLSALAAQRYVGEWEVVVADNGSTDDLASTVESHRARLPGLRIVDASARAGVNHARNAGVAAARGRKVLICDADDRVQPEWLESLAAGLDASPLVGGPVDSLATMPNPPDEQPRGVLTRPGSLGFLPYPIGANCGFLRSVWEQLGGFDESFVGGADEIDFFWRAQLEGHTFDWIDAARVSYTLKTDSEARVRKAFAVNVGDAHLYAKFRQRGFRRRHPLVGLARRLAKIVVRAPGAALYRGERATQWRCDLASLRGRLAGAARYRAVHL